MENGTLSLAPLIKFLSKGLGVNIKVISQDIETAETIDSRDKFKYIAKVCADKSLQHPAWNLIAGRICTEELRRKVKPFHEAMAEIQDGLCPDFYNYVQKNYKILESFFNPDYDLVFDYFAINTLKKSYLLKKEISTNVFVPIELPSYMYMRVAIFTWCNSCEDKQIEFAKIKDTYEMLSKGLYSQASPTYYSAGLKKPACASCYLKEVEDDMGSIARSWYTSAIISMNSGGLGVDFSGLRHSKIGMVGMSSGIVPWLKIENEILKHVNQAGRRPGSGTIFLCDWHVDFEDFIEARRTDGADDIRARDLFYCCWVSDLFMSRVENDEMWSLFCPKRAPELKLLYGTEFENKYLQYESEKIYSRQVKARYLWQKIYSTQKQVGMPFMCFKDAINRKCNQNNLGTIRSSNLCLEITQYTDNNNIATCNLSSLCLDEYVKPSTKADGKPYMDYQMLGDITYKVVENLNQIIDRTYYPKEIPEIKNCNMKNRPMGIGVSALADCFAKLDLCWEDEEAKITNINIFETIYYYALKSSVKQAELYGTYENYKGSPMSKGLLQQDLWDLEYLSTSGKIGTPASLNDKKFITKDMWDSLREDIKIYGVRNSLLVALMPTASTAQIRGKNESFEPYTSNLYTRLVLSGHYMLINKHLYKDLHELNLWTTPVVTNIVKNQGSVHEIDSVISPTEDVLKRIKHIQKKYKTVFELSQKLMLEMNVQRGRFICQSQSQNCFLSDPTYQQMTSYLFTAWRYGAKTGMYYLRQQAGSNNINFALDSVKIQECESCSA